MKIFKSNLMYMFPNIFKFESVTCTRELCSNLLTQLYGCQGCLFEPHENQFYKKNSRLDLFDQQLKRTLPPKNDLFVQE